MSTETETFGCTVPLVDGYCPQGSLGRLHSYEEDLQEQIETAPLDPATHPSPDNLSAFVQSALGWNHLQPRGGGQVDLLEERPYGEGTVREVRIGYTYPAVAVRAILAQHTYPSDHLVMVLHGHTSSADKVLGLDEADYMRVIGQHLFEAGFDVLAFDAPSDWHAAAKMNAQLALWGVQVLGLYGRAVCDASGSGVVKPYRRLSLYGFSNGGVIADYVSVACPTQFATVVVDDILSDWREVVKGNETIHGAQNYAVFYLAPLLYMTSHIDLALASRSPKFYTRAEALIDELVPLDHDRYRGSSGLSRKADANFVYRSLQEHVVDPSLVDAILRGSLDALQGRSIIAEGARR